MPPDNTKITKLGHFMKNLSKRTGLFRDRYQRKFTKHSKRTGTGTSLWLKHPRSSNV